MRALAGSPQTLLAAQGAGVVSIPLWCYWFLDSDGTAFTASGGTVFLYYNSTSKITQFSNSAWNGFTTDYYGWTQLNNAAIGASGGIAATGMANQPITIMNDGANLTGGGSSTVTFLLCYTTITLP